MQVFFQSKQRIFKLILAIGFLIVPLCHAQNANTTDNDPLSLIINCPDNPQCIYSKDNPVQLNIYIQNNTKEDLDIPLEAMKQLTTSFYFKDTLDGKNMIIPDPSWNAPPVLFKELTLLPAHESIMISTLYIIPEDKGIKIAPTHTINFQAKTITHAYLHNSKKPIGLDQNSISKPKQFALEAKQIITKK